MLPSRKSFALLLLLTLGIAACGGSPDPAGGGEAPQWESPPAMAIDTDSIYLATLVTEQGEIKVQLLANRAPVTVNNFVFLAEQGFYDDTTFHRVLEGFMAQGGDPTGTGGGGPGYVFEDEFHPDLTFDGPGYLAMANRGPNTNGSQFFITFGPTPHLNGRHTIFGVVVEGIEAAESLRLRDPNLNPDYDGDRLITVRIEQIDASLLPPPTPTPVPIVPSPEEGRPLADLEPDARGDLYTAPPAMALDFGLSYRATVDTSQGAFVIELAAEEAPAGVNNFIILAELGYWDGFPIVFVEDGVFALTGSPLGRPESDIGYSLPAEVDLPNTANAVGYWPQPTSLMPSGSQFYVLMADAPDLDGRASVFGYVVEGMEAIRNLTDSDQIVQITIQRD